MTAAAELVALVDKYERMVALRARLGVGAPAPAEREALRALARDFPGALRELETVDTAALAARLDAARAAAGGQDAPDWLRWTAAYHALMRRALALKSGAPAGEGEALAVEAPRHGRLNVVVFEALSRRFARPIDEIWDAVFPRRGRAPRAYREA